MYLATDACGSGSRDMLRWEFSLHLVERLDISVSNPAFMPDKTLEPGSINGTLINEFGNRTDALISVFEICTKQRIAFYK